MNYGGTADGRTAFSPSTEPAGVGIAATSAGLFLPGRASDLPGALPLVRGQCCERGNELCTQPAHRLEYTAQSVVSKSVEGFPFVRADLEHARKTCPGLNVRHPERLTTHDLTLG